MTWRVGCLFVGRSSACSSRRPSPVIQPALNHVQGPHNDDRKNPRQHNTLPIAVANDAGQPDCRCDRNAPDHTLCKVERFDVGYVTTAFLADRSQRSVAARAWWWTLPVAGAEFGRHKREVAGEAVGFVGQQAVRHGQRIADAAAACIIDLTSAVGCCTVRSQRHASRPHPPLLIASGWRPEPAYRYAVVAGAAIGAGCKPAALMGFAGSSPAHRTMRVA